MAVAVPASNLQASVVLFVNGDPASGESYWRSTLSQSAILRITKPRCCLNRDALLQKNPRSKALDNFNFLADSG